MTRRGLRQIAGWLVSLVCVAMMALGVVLGELALSSRSSEPSAADVVQAEAIAQRAGQRLENVDIDRGDGARLRAWFIDAAQPEAPTLLLLHGVSAHRGHMLGLMRLVTEQGMAVLAPDARAHGESDGPMSYGVRERDDIGAWIDFILERRRNTCVIGMGVSLGAAQMLQGVAIGHARLCGVIAEASFSSFREVAYDRVGQFVGRGPELGRWWLRPAVDAAFLYVRLRSGADLRRASPVDAIRGAEIPILLIHGSDDDNIPPRHLHALAAANPRAHVWLIPGATHGQAWRAAPDEYPRRVLAFIRQATVPR